MNTWPSGFQQYITIIRRLIAFPFFMIAKILIVASYAFGWGISDAKKLWDNLA